MIPGTTVSSVDRRTAVGGNERLALHLACRTTLTANHKNH
jgi:hypothetical protein